MPTPINLASGRSSSSGDTATTKSVTTVASAAVGDTVLVVVQTNGGDPTTVTVSDSAGNTYTVDDPVSTNAVTIARSVLTTALPAGGTIAVSWPTAATWGVVADCYPGAALSLVGSIAQVSAASGTVYSTSVSETAGDFMYVVGRASSNESSVSVASPYTEIGSAVGPKIGLVTSFNLPSVSGNTTWSCTWSTAHSGNIMVATYSAAAAVPPNSGSFAGGLALAGSFSGVENPAGTIDSSIKWVGKIFGSSKDHPSLNNYSIDTNQQTDLGDVSPYTYVVLQEPSYQTIAAIKAANPNVKVLSYMETPVTKQQTYSANPPAYMPHDTSGVFYGYADTYHPEWFLLDSLGSRLAYTDFTSYMMMDIGNVDYQNTYAANMIAALPADGFDGIWMDDVNTHPGHGQDGNVAKYTNAEYGAAMADFVANVTTQLKAAGLIVAGNVSCDPWTAYQHDNAINIARSLDLYTREQYVRYGSIDGPWSARFNDRGDQGTPPLATMLDFDQEVQAAGAWLSGVDYGATTPTADDIATMTYGRASFLLAWDGTYGAAYAFRRGGVVDPAYPEWMVEVGAPTSNAILTGAVFSRTFTEGLVYLNPSSTASVQVTVPAGYVDANGNSVSGTVTMPLETALVLKQAPNAGTISGNISWVGNFSGTAKHSGSFSGTMDLTGAFSGTAPLVGPNSGFFSGNVSWVGGISGQAKHSGSASGAISWVGDFSGTSRHSGDISGGLVWSGQVSGQAKHSSNIIGSIDWLGATSGAKQPIGTAGGAINWLGAFSGTTPAVGARSGSFIGQLGWAGDVSGHATHAGGVAGDIAWVGSFSGTAPAVPAHAGVFSGTFSLAGNIAGQAKHYGVFDAGIAWAGAFSSQVIPVGWFNGSIDWSGAFAGRIGIVAFAPASRTLIIIADDRVYAVGPDGRTYTIDSEDRLVQVMAEDRVFPVDGESRTLEVPAQ